MLFTERYLLLRIFHYFCFKNSYKKHFVERKTRVENQTKTWSETTRVYAQKPRLKMLFKNSISGYTATTVYNKRWPDRIFYLRDYTWSSGGRAVLGSVGRPLVVDRSTRDRTSRPSLFFCLPKPRSGLTGKATGSVILSSIVICSWLFVSSLLASGCLLSLSLSLLLPLSLSLLLPLSLSLLLPLSLSSLLPLSLSSSSSSVSKGASPLGPGMAGDISSLKIKEHKWLKPGFIYAFRYEKSQQVYKKRYKFWAILHAVPKSSII